MLNILGCPPGATRFVDAKKKNCRAGGAPITIKFMSLSLRPTLLDPLVRAYDRVAARTAGRLLSGPRFAGALVLYLVLIALIKGQLYLGGLGHDADQLVLSQAFQLGYDARNPPLFTWLVIAAGGALGPGLGAVLAVKSLTMLVLYGFLYLAARRALRDPALAVLAALAPFAMYEVGLWLAIKYSNTAALAALCMASVYVLLRLGESGRTFWYVSLGSSPASACSPSTTTPSSWWRWSSPACSTPASGPTCATAASCSAWQSRSPSSPRTSLGW